MKKRTITWSLIGAGAIVAAAVAVFLILGMQREGPIKIGTILSLSGPGSQTGQSIRDGMLLAVDEINSWGGIDGRKIELIIGDSKTKPSEGRRAFKKIESGEGPVLYVSCLSSVSTALAPLAEKNKVVLFGLSVTAKEFTKQNEWVFRYFPTTEFEVPPVLSILKRSGIKKLGVLCQDDEFGRSVSKLLRSKFEKTGGTVKIEPFDVKGADLRPQIEKLKDMEAIYVVGFPSNLVKAIRELAKADFKGLVIASNGASRPSIRGMPEANGVYVAAPIVYDPSFLFARQAKEKYEAKYGKTFNHIVANGYDFMKLLAGLMENKEISRKSLKTSLDQGFIYPGIFGELDVEPGERDICFVLHPARIVNGELEYLR
ncbi:MAG: ABC transporter substrate-binding protein [Deltaproteobacteria bacterium]|nr:ABC transporter substrate-binding protein [Deltaproteobacteria bacterium]